MSPASAIRLVNRDRLWGPLHLVTGAPIDRGLSRIIKPEDLPKPGATSSVTNPPYVVPRPPTAIPQVPPGFKVELFADGLSGPREMRVAPNGDIFVAQTRAGRIRVLRAADGDSKSVNEIFASGLNQPFGIAFFPSGDNPQWVYVANMDSVVRFSYAVGNTKASGKPEIIVAKLPNGVGHSTRNLVFTKDNRMLVSVGSRSNDAAGIERLLGVMLSWFGAGSETDRAAVLMFDPNGKRLGVFATGIRNCVGLAVHPKEWRFVLLDQRARWFGRRLSAGLHYSGARRCILRLALVLHRRQRRSATYWRASRFEGEDRHSRCSNPSPFRLARHDVFTMAKCFRLNMGVMDSPPNTDHGIDQNALAIRSSEFL